MPLFNHSPESEIKSKHQNMMGYVYSLADCFERRIPVTSIEFNPPAVSAPNKQEAAYWLALSEPDAEDQKVLKALRAKHKAMVMCRRSGSFMSLTDSAAGVLRLNNLDMLRLFEDPIFCHRMLDTAPAHWEHNRVILHLTRNHSVAWTRAYLKRAHSLGFTQLLLITGDPLKEVRLKTVTAAQAEALSNEEAHEFRLKNSTEMLHFAARMAPNLYCGAAHNPFMKKQVAEKHLLAKIEAGARFLITQPVSYYDECWRFMADFQAFQKEKQLTIPVVLGVFNYSVPCTAHGYKPEIYQKRHAFWKRLFGFVPAGVREDYDSGLNGIEILARSINKLKRMGYFHFDVMNAERNGYSVVIKGRNFTRELDRFVGVFNDQEIRKR